MNYPWLLVPYGNAHGRREATLQSADPTIPLKFNPRFLVDPFGRRAAIESLRDLSCIVRHEDMLEALC